jgi:hypothetical protein
MNNDNNIPCDECITKAICLNKDTITCHLLINFLKIKFKDYIKTENSFPVEVSSKVYTLEIQLFRRDTIILWMIQYLFSNMRKQKIKFKYLYKTLKEEELKPEKYFLYQLAQKIKKERMK